MTDASKIDLKIELRDMLIPPQSPGDRAAQHYATIASRRAPAPPQSRHK
jgi:hypothetical protein